MDSSIAADWYLRHVFMDLLVLADRDGIVDMTLDAIRRHTNAPDETMLAAAIRRLEQPDEASRSETDDGRRIELIDDHRDWGWRIINYPKYRNLKTSQEIREQTAERVRRHRAKKRGVTASVTQAEAYANADISTRVGAVENPRAEEKPAEPPPLQAPGFGLKKMPRTASKEEIEERRRRLLRQAEVIAGEKP